MVNLHFSQELAYQEVLHKLGDLSSFNLQTPLPLHDLLKIALNPPGSSSSSSTAFQDEIEKKSLKAVALLTSKAELLQEYFGLGIDIKAMSLVSLPEIIDEYAPFMGHIPFLLLSLATEVNWAEEQACLDGIARRLSRAYSLHRLQFSSQEDTDGPNQAWVVEHMLLPSLRLRFSPPRELAKDGTVVQITSLEKLYKVFERC
jgi:DNA mismatch repair protein MLH1